MHFLVGLTYHYSVQNPSHITLLLQYKPISVAVPQYYFASERDILRICGIIPVSYWHEHCKTQTKFLDWVSKVDSWREDRDKPEKCILDRVV